MPTTPVVTPKQQLRPLTEFNNAQILNMIRNEASPEYQRRMPSATQMNMDRQMATLMSSTQLKNEFYAALVNRIGGTYVNTWRWNNPMSVFQRALSDVWRHVAGNRRRYAPRSGVRPGRGILGRGQLPQVENRRG